MITAGEASRRLHRRKEDVLALIAQANEDAVELILDNFPHLPEEIQVAYRVRYYARRKKAM